MIDEVPPRVIPLFINELVTSSPSVRHTHMKHFMTHLSAIFKARVVDEDIADLFVVLCSICRSPSCMEPVADAADAILNPQGVIPAFTALRLLLELVDVRKPHSVLCVRVIKKLFDRFLRAIDEAQEGKGRHGLIGHLPRGGTAKSDIHSMTSRSAATHTTNDASTIDASAILPGGRMSIMHGDESAVNHDNDLVRSAEAPNAMEALHIECLLANDLTRPAAIALLETLDRCMCDVSLLSSEPEKLHIFLPNRMTAQAKVYRDFVCCTQRPKLSKQWGSFASVHIKTNIAAKSEVMYRILVEGYNYGVNAPIFSDIAGYTNRNWDELGKMTKYGWPEGWDDHMSNDYAPGATIGQYFSRDGFVVIRLRAKSMFSVGFSVSAWLCFHGMGSGFPIAATIHHQDVDL